jgi:acyl-[acyl-carrier-protein]-phospholipid O-acyltransferase/long-chain-fatty-acid--[acyl-carrier-protein] ligase
MAHITSLTHWRFLSFLAATFLGSFNDNAFKLVVSLAALSLIADPTAQQSYLAMTSALAILPFVLFSGYAGYFADRYAKSSVLRISKATEILAMGAALVVFISGHSMTHLLITLFLLALHSAFYAPSKYSILPEILRAEDLPKANGFLNMLTFVAIILGSLAGATLWGQYKSEPTTIGWILTGIAVLGTVLCLFVPQSAKGNPHKRFDPNPFGEIARGVTAARHHRVIVASMFGTCMFWMLGGLIYLSLILLGKTQLGLSESASGALFAFLAIGIAVGSVIAGLIVGKSIRRTVIVWGALILSLGCILTGFYSASYATVATLITLVGLGGGLFVVPLATLMQKYAPEEKRGQILATSSFFDMVGVLAASGIFWVLGTTLHLSASSIIATAGAFSLMGLLVAIYFVPKLLHDPIESAIYFIARRFYRIRLVGDGLEHGAFPQPTKPTVFIANHVTFVDGLLISMLSKQPIRFLVLSSFWKQPFTRFFLNAMDAIPFGTGSPGETRKGLEAAREALAKGQYVCIFPEGALTRTGHLHPFKRGIEKLLEGTEAQVVPIYLERLWGSIFSFKRGRFIRKLPQQIPYPVTVAVGKPLPATTPAWQLNQIISELGTDTVPLRYGVHETLGRRFIFSAKRGLYDVQMRDTTGAKMNGLKLLVGARLTAKWLRPKLGTSLNVAVLLPASVGGVMANLALALLGKTSVNLNFSLGRTALEAAIEKAQISSIITSRKVVEKLGITEDARMQFIEDALMTSRLSRLGTMLQALLLSERSLCRRWLKGEQRADATATILFSSGSTSSPKAIMLSHMSILANIESVNDLLQHAERTEPDPYTLAAVLPFFHSFGLTVCLWLPAITGRRVSYHSNPLEAKSITRMIQNTPCHVLIATPTFAKHYAAAAKENALASVRLVILGGEKLTDATETELNAAIPQARMLQGYGCTELGPVVAINVPDVVHGALTHRGYCKGSVGKPLPGVSIRIAHRDTGEMLPPGEEGLILVKSPSLMQGYYLDPILTHDVITAGWYFTGDIGLIDKDGFLHITDRLARFSKIGGEMVPHGKVEEVLEGMIGNGCTVAVVAVADAAKGEKLCVLLTTESTLDIAQLHAQLKQAGLPNLWVPARECFFVVDALPQLATGKRDLRACKALAEARMATA